MRNKRIIIGGGRAHSQAAYRLAFASGIAASECMRVIESLNILRRISGSTHKYKSIDRNLLLQTKIITRVQQRDPAYQKHMPHYKFHR